MAKTFTAAFAQTPKTANASTLTAITGVNTLTPTGTVSLLTAGADGAVVTRISFMPTGTITAVCAMLFITKDSGATIYLTDAAILPAFTYVTTASIPLYIFESINEDYPLRLEAGDTLHVGVSSTITSPIMFTAQFTNY